ncbi:hypothetical protein Tco_0703197 [Tanacetum coccineum]|uniref:Uncharacterized protein n=1 Tax=Tanacetum coccineum TaxID=301880 RepID=A0ABQ4XZ03_9ASTR
MGRGVISGIRLKTFESNGILLSSEFIILQVGTNKEEVQCALIATPLVNSDGLQVRKNEANNGHGMFKSATWALCLLRENDRYTSKSCLWYSALQAYSKRTE